MGNCYKKSIKVKNNNILEIKNYYNNINDFECCVCLEESTENICMIECKHHICKKCYLKCLNQDEKCPICRQEIKPINIDKSKYLLSVYSNEMKKYENYSEMVNKISYLNYTNIPKEQYKIILNDFIKICIIKIIGNEILFIFIPYFKNNLITRVNLNNINKTYFIKYISNLHYNKLYTIWYDNEKTFLNLVNYFNIEL